MWRRLPLNIKLIFSIIVVQMTVFALGTLWFTHWLDKTLTRELYVRLDTLTDVIEDMINNRDGILFLNRAGELVRELENEQESYAFITSNDDHILFESNGPSPEIRRNLQAHFQSVSRLQETTRIISLFNGRWIIQGKPLVHLVNKQKTTPMAFVAIHAQPTFDELLRIKRYITFSALIILLLTSVGTGFVVSYSTRNIRRFSNQLHQIKPPRFNGHIDLIPQSAEEELLFTSYSKMMKTIRTVIDAQRLFIAHASHELKTPIAASMSALEVLLSKPRSSTAYEKTCSDVLAEVKVLNRLSNALLDLARLEDSGVSQSSTDSCSLNQVICHIEQRWQKICVDREIRLQTSSEEAGADLVIGSAEQWEVIVGNLVDNAIKYGKKGGGVEVTVQAISPSSLEIVVEDNGRGMSAEEIVRLGEVFFRAEAARSEAGSFGLGFAHAKRIIEFLGNKIYVESTLGKGTMVVVSAQRRLT